MRTTQPWPMSSRAHSRAMCTPWSTTVPVDRKPAPRHAARRGELVVQEGARVQEADAQGLDLLRHGPEDRLRVAALEGEEDLRGLQVRLAARGTGAWGSPGPPSGRSPPRTSPRRRSVLPTWPTCTRVAVGLGKRRDELGGGLALERDQPQRDARPAGGLGHQLRIDPLARDQRDRQLRVERLREDTLKAASARTVAP